MRIQEMHYDVRFKLDKIDSNQKRNFIPAQIDWALNEGQWLWLKDAYGLTDRNRPKPSGFENTEQLIQDLKALHIKSPEQQAALTATTIDSTTYGVSLENLTFEHLFTTRIRARITKNGCSKVVGVKIEQTDDLNDALVDPFNRPNFKFGKVVGVYGSTVSAITSVNHFQGNGTLYIYTDGSTVDEVYIDYIKYPNRMWFGSYDLTSDLSPKSVSNTYIYQAGVDNPVHCELNSHVHNEIVDEAVELISSGIEDPNLIQLKTRRSINNK
mgnify:CR=1 FL=1